MGRSRLTCPAGAMAGAPPAARRPEAAGRRCGRHATAAGRSGRPRVHGVGDGLPALDLLVRPDARRAGVADAHAASRGGLGRIRPAPARWRVVFGHQRVRHPRLAGAGAGQRRHDDAVLQGQRRQAAAGRIAKSCEVLSGSSLFSPRGMICAARARLSRSRQKVEKARLRLVTVAAFWRYRGIMDLVLLTTFTALLFLLIAAAEPVAARLSAALQRDPGDAWHPDRRRRHRSCSDRPDRCAEPGGRGDPGPADPLERVPVRLPADADLPGDARDERAPDAG